MCSNWQDDIRKQLLELADSNYREFSARLLPTVDNIIGVRLTELRRLAKEIAKEDWRMYLKTSKDEYFEELMLKGMVIGYAKGDLEELLDYVSEFVCKINSWSVCDSFCSSLKFTKKNKRAVWDFLKTYLNSEREYELRFAVVMLLDYYIEKDYIDRVLIELDKIDSEAYYVKMAVAWAISTCYIKFPERTLIYLNDNRLDDFTYNKAIQKIVESRRIDLESKIRMKELKR